MFAYLKTRTFIVVPVLTGILLSGCLAVTPAAPAAAESAAEPSAVIGAVAPSASSASLEQPEVDADSQSVAEALLYMREEEKLAHDVYVTLYDVWGMPVFDNISQSESQHTNMVLQELEARGLTDPAAGKGPGEFSNPELQALYDDLVTQGSESAVAALNVGATVEDLDISDLQTALETVTDEHVRLIFENLMRGSENHLQAFVRNLARYGETYEPQYVDAEYYEATIGDADLPGNTRGAGRGRWAVRQR